MFWPCETRTSTCRSFATISSGLYRFLAIAVLLGVKDIPQVGPLQWGWIMQGLTISNWPRLDEALASNSMNSRHLTCEKARQQQEAQRRSTLSLQDEPLRPQLCVPKIRSCNIGDEGLQGRAVT